MNRQFLQVVLWTTAFAANWACVSKEAGPDGAALSNRAPATDAANEAIEDLTPLELAALRYREAPEVENHVIWYGRQLAYAGLYDQAINIYSTGLERDPDSFRLLRHRGHRYITTREFRSAVDDLERAARLVEGLADEIEPDGRPNDYGIPRSTTQTNIFYHLGLAHYLLGDYESAVGAYAQCKRLSPNDDMLVASAYWLFLSGMRSSNSEAALEAMESVAEEMEILENHAYHQLLLLFAGKRDELTVLGDEEADLAFATRAYGVAAWRHLQGRQESAIELLERILATDQVAAFGFLAAEADRERLATSL